MDYQFAGEKDNTERKFDTKVSFENDWYFDIESEAALAGEYLSGVEDITVPIAGEYKKTAKIEEIEKGRKRKEL